MCQNVSARDSLGGTGPLNVNLGSPIISETTGAKKLKLKTQLHVVKYFRYTFFSARWHPEGAGPPSVNLGPPDISETTTARKLNLKIPLDMVKYPHWVQKLYYMTQHEDGCHIDFRQMSSSEADYDTIR